jgi:integrase
MYKRVFKQKGSRVYRARYRLSNGPQTFDVPLRTDKKHVAEAKLAKLIREQEEELSGLLAPKPLRSAASKPIAEHLSNYVAHLGALSCKPKHLAFTRNRITRLCEECDWRLLRDISADGFNHWRAAQTALGPKTCNHYLGHISGFLTWLVANGRLSHHPLKTVAKAETRGLERCVRRALTDSESDRLIQSPGGRGLIYFVALFTGLRRGEIKALLWVDMHLDGASPYIAVRSATTKNSKTAQQPLVPSLTAALRIFREQEQATEGKMFRHGMPLSETFHKDLAASGIPLLDELGRRVDFHALRHTFNTMLQRAGVPPRIIMELMRHSDLRLSSTTYTDTTCLPLYSEVVKLNAFLPSPLASPNSDKSGLNVDKLGETDTPEGEAGIVAFPSEKNDLAKLEPTWPELKLAEREGFEPPVTLRLHVLSKHAH